MMLMLARRVDEARATFQVRLVAVRWGGCFRGVFKNAVS